MVKVLEENTLVMHDKAADRYHVAQFIDKFVEHKITSESKAQLSLVLAAYYNELTVKLLLSAKKDCLSIPVFL